MQVTIQEAANTLGIAESTVRRRIRNGELEGQQMPTPQGYTWLVDLPEDLALGKENEPRPEGESAIMRELVDSLRSHLEGLENQLGTKDRQIEQLHVLLQQVQAALPPPRAGRPWWRVWQRSATAQ
jgi:excisionase family DNA binding protein